jgi:enoyl-CoA hydratase/carnithine racemase
MSNLILLEINDSVATITINRPEKRNSITPEMLENLEQIVSQVANDKSVRLVLLQGSGDKAFSTGADLNAFSAHDRDSARRNWIPDGHRIYRRLAQLPQVSIAILNGDALGGGLELALACDFRVGKRGARVGLPEVSIGTFPGWGGTGRLVDVIGLNRAKQLILAGTTIDMETAFQWGLANILFDGDLSEESFQQFISPFLKVSPIAQQIGKQVMAAFENKTNSEVLEALAGSLSVTTNDFKEGVDAFKNKRSANFEGK